MRILIPILLVAGGGALGALSRFGLSYAIYSFHTSRWPDLDHAARFPWWTLTVNVLGSFLLGIVGELIVEKTGGTGTGAGDFLRYAVAVGFLGSFTTFSTFESETSGLLSSGQWFLGAFYISASVFIGLVAMRLGIAVGSTIGG